MKVELDKRALFALASDSRVEILKALQSQRRTVTQLAEALEIDKAAVHRHLKKLEEGELVVRFEDHGFVYYGLSWKARDIISPGENTKIVVVFSTTALMVAGAATAVLAALSQAASGAKEASQNQAGGMNGALNAVPGVSWEIVLLGGALAVIAIVLGFIGWRRVRRPRQSGSDAKGVRPTAGFDPDE